jgi:hypothetical protein
LAASRFSLAIITSFPIHVQRCVALNDNTNLTLEKSEQVL